MAKNIKLSDGIMANIGRFCASKPILIISIWIIVLIVSLVLRNNYGGIFNDNVNLSGSQSNSGLNLLNANDASAGGYGDQIVFYESDGKLVSHKNSIESLLSNVRSLNHVLVVSNPFAKNSDWSVPRILDSIVYNS